MCFIIVSGHTGVTAVGGKKKKGIGHVGFLDLFAFLDLMLSGHVGLSEVLYIAYSHIILSRKFKQNFGLVADSHVVSMFFCGQ